MDILRRSRCGGSVVFWELFLLQYNGTEAASFRPLMPETSAICSTSILQSENGGGKWPRAESKTAPCSMNWRAICVTNGKSRCEPDHTRNRRSQLRRSDSDNPPRWSANLKKSDKANPRP